MNILLDTHIIICALTDDERLSKKAKNYLIDSNNNIYFSPISIWEIELKHATHPNQLNFNGSSILNYLKDGEYIECPIISKHITFLENIKIIESKTHTDPFDKLLLATAVANNFSFMTHDDKFKYYKYKNILLIQGTSNK